MTVYFIGAGPGDPELLTLKAQRLIAACPVCLYAGSLVPAEVVASAPEGARVLDTAPMTLDETHAEIVAAHCRGQDVARVHSGDPSLYGAIAEQIRRLKADGIDYEIVPGVPAYAAAAAALGQELTIPEVAQSIVLTRMSMKSTGDARGRDAGELRPHRRHAGDPPGRAGAARDRAAAEPRTMAPIARWWWPIAWAGRIRC